jgi:SAM-dependent methyltransferase
MSFEAKYYEATEFWAEGMLTNAGNTLRLAETIALIPQDVRSLLDVGCGNGVFPNRLARERPDIHVTATDRSQAALKFVNTDKFESDMIDIPRADASFDCVTCLQVIEHLTHDRYRRALAELARVAGRYIIIGIPYKEDLERDFTQCPQCLSKFNLNLHFRSYDAASIRSLFEADGFECIADKNIAQVRRLYGQGVYAAARRLLAPPPPARFDSPICLVCGYENRAFETPSTSSAEEGSAPRPGIKSLIRRFWPGYFAPGYWSIALYERRKRRSGEGP